MRRELLVIILLIMVVFPILINLLMFIPSFKVAGDENTWISLLGTFWGAIIGGVIAGILTLLGVQRTIKHNEEIKEKNDFPAKIHRLEKVCFYLDDIYEEVMVLLSKTEKGYQPGYFFTIVDNQLYKQPYFYKYTDELFEKIGSELVYVDSYSYREFFQFRKEINDLFKTVMGDISIKIWNFSQKDSEISEDFNDLYKTFLENELEYISSIGHCLGQFKWKLSDHYLSLVKKMDY